MSGTTQNYRFSAAVTEFAQDVKKLVEDVKHAVGAEDDERTGGLTSKDGAHQLH